MVSRDYCTADVIIQEAYVGVNCPAVLVVTGCGVHGVEISMDVRHLNQGRGS